LVFPSLLLGRPEGFSSGNGTIEENYTAQKQAEGYTQQFGNDYYLLKKSDRFPYMSLKFFFIEFNTDAWAVRWYQVC
jgi:hypothetical protein